MTTDADIDKLPRPQGARSPGGSAALARVMGPDEDLAKILAGPVKCFVHERCAGEKLVPILIAMERASEQPGPEEPR